MYDLLWFPSPRIWSRIGSASSLRTKSNVTPCVCLGPTTFANRNAAACIPNMWQYAESIASHASLLAPYVEIGCILPASSRASSSPRSPYTPEPDVYVIRSTPFSRTASSRLFVRNVPCQKSIDGSSTARAMSGFAARWYTWSEPSTCFVSSSRSLRSPTTSSKRLFSRASARCSSLPELRLSYTLTLPSGSARSRGPKLPPKKPAPPATKYRVTSVAYPGLRRVLDEELRTARTCSGRRRRGRLARGERALGPAGGHGHHKHWSQPIRAGARL